jgi:WD40 repeat protein
MAFNPADGGLAVFQRGEELGIILCDPRTGKTNLHWLPGQDKSDRGGLLFRSDGRQLARISQNGITIWDTQSGKLSQYHNLNGVRLQGNAVFRSDGRLLVTPWVKDKLRFVVKDIRSGVEIGPGIGVETLDAAGRIPGVSIPRFSGDGRLLFLRRLGGPRAASKIRVWEYETGKWSGDLLLAPNDNNSVGIDFATSFDGQWVCLPARDANAPRSDEVFIQMWHVPTQKQHWQSPLSAVLQGMPEISPDNRLVAIGYTTGLVEIRELATGEEILRWQMPAGKPVEAKAFSADSAYLAIHDGTAPVHLLHLGELRKALDEMGLGW